MAWTLDGTTIIPYEMDAPHENTPSTFDPVPLVGGGDRVGITTGRKRWTFLLKWTSTTDADSIATSLKKQSFVFHDEYKNADFTVHCIKFSLFKYIEISKVLTGATITLQVV